MNPFKALLAALVPELDEHADRTRAAAASLKTLRGDVKALRHEIEALAARVDAVSRQLAQVRLLRQADRDGLAMLDDLARLMATDRVAAHVRAAVDRAAWLEHPGPRLRIDALWPEDVDSALAAAIPDPVFFDSSISGAQTLRVPPRLAPVAALAVWRHIAGIVEDVLVPAVAARLRPRLEPRDVSGAAPIWSLESEPGRLVRGPAGAAAPPVSPKPWQWGLLVIDLSGANSAEAGFSATALDSSLAWDAGIRCTYEVWFGTARGRERSDPA